MVDFYFTTTSSEQQEREQVRNRSDVEKYFITTKKRVSAGESACIQSLYNHGHKNEPILTNKQIAFEYLPIMGYKLRSLEQMKSIVRGLRSKDKIPITVTHADGKTTQGYEWTLTFKYGPRTYKVDDQKMNRKHVRRIS